MSGPITIRIDTLAFPGLGAAEAGRAAEAFAAELARLLEQHGLPRHRAIADLERIDPGRFAAPAATPEATGRAIARALFERVAA